MKHRKGEEAKIAWALVLSALLTGCWVSWGVFRYAIRIGTSSNDSFKKKELLRSVQKFWKIENHDFVELLTAGRPAVAGGCKRPTIVILRPVFRRSYSEHTRTASYMATFRTYTGGDARMQGLGESTRAVQLLEGGEVWFCCLPLCLSPNSSQLIHETHKIIRTIKRAALIKTVNAAHVFWISRPFFIHNLWKIGFISVSFGLPLTRVHFNYFKHKLSRHTTLWPKFVT